MSALQSLQDTIVRCIRCPRLVAHREAVAERKRRMYMDWEYWGRPVPSFGDPQERLLIVGLAPAAHGANRTGRMFTGDRSGDLLYGTLHKLGFASSPHSRRRDDGLALHDAYITAAVRCTPPANKPIREELASCRSYLVEEQPARGRRAGESRLRRLPRDPACHWRARAHPPPPFRPRRHGRVGQRCHAYRLLPPQPAEHTDGQAHTRHARGRVTGRAADSGGVWTAFPLTSEWAW